jgi:hypothetical protein
MPRKVRSRPQITAAPAIEKPVRSKRGGGAKKGGARAGAGRPAHEPTAKGRKLVKELVGYGIDRPGIARMLSIHLETLEKHYQHELAIGEPGLKANMMRLIVMDAINNKNPKSAQWVMEKRFLVGAIAASRGDRTDFSSITTVNIGSLNDSQLVQFIRRLEPLALPGNALPGAGEGGAPAQRADQD